MSQDTKDDKLQALTHEVERLKSDLLEYYRTEQVVIAAGLLTRDQFNQAHDIVRSQP